MRIGIFGGTFDPPHIGHLILAAEAIDQLDLDKLFWVLTPEPPHKTGKNISSVKDRLLLVEAITKGDLQFELSRVEIDRPGPHYAVDTVRIIANQYVDSQLYYLMGGDSLRDLSTWHDGEGILAICEGLGVMQRPGAELDMAQLEEHLSGVSKKVHIISAPLLDISSTQIRERIRKGKPFRYFLSAEVYRLICDNHLYK